MDPGKRMGDEYHEIWLYGEYAEGLHGLFGFPLAAPTKTDTDMYLLRHRSAV